MPKPLLAACLLSLLVSVGCRCHINDWMAINYDPFDKRTIEEKWADREEDEVMKAQAEADTAYASISESASCTISADFSTNCDARRRIAAHS
ncbi:MAG: hypothetical protein L0211_04785, partial [Planctomycetaceae bacterium]|nr:hypothetical protein [Planctomycetaceae bacterium]